MIKAYVLITAESGKVLMVQESLQAVPSIDKVAIVSGVYDLIAVFETDEPHYIARTVLNHIQGTEGVLRTATLLELG